MGANDEIVKELEAGAKAAGITIARLCQLADHNNSTFTRMKNGTTSPNFATVQDFRTAINKALKAKARRATRKSEGSSCSV